ncbi:MAG: tetratricopeptide (TPR) repeat protein, partial [Myxococcota bacterium]
PGERVVAIPSRRAPLGIEITQVTVAAAKPKKPSKTGPTKPKPEKPEKPEEPKPEKPKPGKAEPSSGDYDGLMAAARQALKSKSTKRALKYLKLAAQLNPRSVEPVAKMGWAYLYMGNATQAILKFQEAKQKNPGYRDTYIGLGKAMERAGRTQDAIRVYQQYLRMCPNCRKAEGVRKSLMRLGAEP